MNFKEKVQSMTGKQIVQAMIDGLKKQWVPVVMEEWVKIKDGICFGCAATNTVCNIIGKSITPKDATVQGIKGSFIGSDSREEIEFLGRFESAINCLRNGDFSSYNSIASEEGFSTLPYEYLPELETDNYKELLPNYQNYADSL